MTLTRGSVIGLCVFSLYVLTAFRVGELYPFARFHMFDEVRDQASRIVARTAAGEAREIAEFVNWSCAAPTSVDASCRSSYSESDARARAELAKLSRPRNATHPAERVNVVRRDVSAPDREGPMQIRYCVILECSAEPR